MQRIHPRILEKGDAAMRRLIAWSVMAGVALAALVPAAAFAAGTKQITANADSQCPPGPLVVTYQISNITTPPGDIIVRSNRGDVRTPQSNYDGIVAHYTASLSGSLLGATAKVPIDWDGDFSVSDCTASRSPNPPPTAPTSHTATPTTPAPEDTPVASVTPTASVPSSLPPSDEAIPLPVISQEPTTAASTADMSPATSGSLSLGMIALLVLGATLFAGSVVGVGWALVGGIMWLCRKLFGRGNAQEEEYYEH